MAMVRQAGSALVTKLPRLWERMSGALFERSVSPEASAAPAQAATDPQVPSQSWWEESGLSCVVQDLMRRNVGKVSM